MGRTYVGLKFERPKARSLATVILRLGILIDLHELFLDPGGFVEQTLNANFGIETVPGGALLINPRITKFRSETG